MIKNMNNFF